MTRRSVAGFSQFVLEPVDVVIVSSRITADQSRRIRNRIAWVAAAAAAAVAAAYDLFQEIGIAGSAAKDAAQPSETNRRPVSACVCVYATDQFAEAFFQQYRTAIEIRNMGLTLASPA